MALYSFTAFVKKTLAAGSCRGSCAYIQAGRAVDLVARVGCVQLEGVLGPVVVVPGSSIHFTNYLTARKTKASYRTVLVEQKVFFMRKIADGFTQSCSRTCHTYRCRLRAGRVGGFRTQRFKSNFSHS